jgi:hypothetical protein
VRVRRLPARRPPVRNLPKVPQLPREDPDLYGGPSPPPPGSMPSDPLDANEC